MEFDFSFSRPVGFHFRLWKIMEFANKRRKKDVFFCAARVKLFVQSLVSCLLIGEPNT
jgi:hypothetical protein